MLLVLYKKLKLVYVLHSQPTSDHRSRIRDKKTHRNIYKGNIIAFQPLSIQVERPGYDDQKPELEKVGVDYAFNAYAEAGA